MTIRFRPHQHDGDIIGPAGRQGCVDQTTALRLQPIVTVVPQDLFDLGFFDYAVQPIRAHQQRCGRLQADGIVIDFQRSAVADGHR